MKRDFEAEKAELQRLKQQQHLIISLKAENVNLAAKYEYMDKQITSQRILEERILNLEYKLSLFKEMQIEHEKLKLTMKNTDTQLTTKFATNQTPDPNVKLMQLKLTAADDFQRLITKTFGFEVRQEDHRLIFQRNALIFQYDLEVKEVVVLEGESSIANEGPIEMYLAKLVLSQQS